MALASSDKISLSDYKWLNEPKHWRLDGDVLEVTTDNKTDFWQGTWYNFHFNSGHVYGVMIKDDFTFTVRNSLIKFYFHITTNTNRAMTITIREVLTAISVDVIVKK